MKINGKVIFIVSLLVIFLSTYTVVKATTLTDIDTSTLTEELYGVDESAIEDISLDPLLPSEVEIEYNEILDVEKDESAEISNQEVYTTGTLVDTGTTTMTQYEKGRLNSKVPTVDASLKIYDYANLFSDSEEKELYDSVNSFIEENNMDMAIVTISQNPEYSAMRYADDFYDYNEFGKNSANDGVLFLIDMDTREMWISTTGSAIKKINDREIDKILDKCYVKIKNKNYYGCASEFIKYTGILVKSSGSQTTFMPEFSATQLLAGTIGAFVIGSIYYAIGVSKHKLVKRQNGAKNYENKLNLTLNSDVLINHRVDRIYSPQSSSSGGSFGGGSSTHFGSSGISHGGGGRHF